MNSSPLALPFVLVHTVHEAQGHQTQQADSADHVTGIRGQSEDSFILQSSHSNHSYIRKSYLCSLNTPNEL